MDKFWDKFSRLVSRGFDEKWVQNRVSNGGKKTRDIFLVMIWIGVLAGL